MSSSNTSATRLSISAVERDTGLSKDTLRVWEKRYRFPLPDRDEHGERVYTPADIEKLRTIKRLVDRGHRPGKIMACTDEELRQLAEPPADESPAAPRSQELVHVIELVRSHRVAELRQNLAQALMRQGLATFLLETVAPLNVMVGDAWMRGQFEIFEEHLYTETLQGLLRNALAGAPQHGRPPRILLTTFPGEQHQLGLLMAEGMLTVEDATCISLGTQTPVWDIALAAGSHHADVVALSFSVAYPANQAAEGLDELRDKLPANVEIWVGGANPAVRRRIAPGILAMPDLEAIPKAVAGWRAAHRGA